MNYKKCYHFLDIYALILLGLFFSWHIFQGELGLFGNIKYQKKNEILNRKLKRLKKYQKRLINEIDCLKQNANMDYIECRALQYFTKVNPQAKILKAI